MNVVGGRYVIARLNNRNDGLSDAGEALSRALVEATVTRQEVQGRNELVVAAVDVRCDNVRVLSCSSTSEHGLEHGLIERWCPSVRCREISRGPAERDKLRRNPSRL